MKERKDLVRKEKRLYNQQYREKDRRVWIGNFIRNTPLKENISVKNIVREGMN